MKKLIYPVLIFLPFLLTACGPSTVFDIPKDQWDQLNQHQRSQVIDGYNQRAQAEAEIAPIYLIADALIAKNKATNRENLFNSNLDDHLMIDNHIPKIGGPLPFPNIDN